jgi:hypothetical protein
MLEEEAVDGVREVARHLLYVRFVLREAVQ